MTRKTTTGTATAANEPEAIAPTLTGPVDGRAYKLLELPLTEIEVGPNVRSELGDLSELAGSIRARGVLQPIGVIRSSAADGGYLLEFGQRRLAASVLAGRTTIPALVSDGAESAVETSIDQLVENVQRADLTPIDEARAMRAIVDAGMAQSDLAVMLGRHPSTISNALRLLGLDPAVQEAVAAGTISKSHAKAIGELPKPQQKAIASTIADRRLSAKPMSSHELEQTIAYRRSDADQAAKKAAKTAKAIPAVLELLAGVEPGTSIEVTGDYYGFDVEAAAKAIRKAGWTVEHVGRYSNGRPPGCDCTALEVSLEGRKPKLKPVCVIREHITAQVDAKRATDEAEAAIREARWHAVGGAVRPALGALPAGVLRVLATELTNLFGNDLELVAHGEAGVVADVIVRQVMRPYRNAGQDEKVLGYLAELGIADPAAVDEAPPAPTAAAAPRKRRSPAQRQAAINEAVEGDMAAARAELAEAVPA